MNVCLMKYFQIFSYKQTLERGAKKDSLAPPPPPPCFHCKNVKSPILPPLPTCQSLMLNVLYCNIDIFLNYWYKVSPCLMSKKEKEKKVHYCPCCLGWPGSVFFSKEATSCLSWKPSRSWCCSGSVASQTRTFFLRFITPNLL